MFFKSLLSVRKLIITMNSGAETGLGSAVPSNCLLEKRSSRTREKRVEAKSRFIDPPQSTTET